MWDNGQWTKRFWEVQLGEQICIFVCIFACLKYFRCQNTAHFHLDTCRQDCTALESYRGCSCLIFGCDNLEVNSRSTVFMLQSNRNMHLHVHDWPMQDFAKRCHIAQEDEPDPAFILPFPCFYSSAYPLHTFFHRGQMSVWIQPIVRD